MIREIVTIDEELCDGCGLCVPACHEGALRIVDGKARLASDRLCDGLGACLGHCPRGAIKIEHREAEEFDEAAVAAQAPAAAHEHHEHAGPHACPSAQLQTFQPAGGGEHGHDQGCGCPGARFAQFAAGAEASKESGGQTCAAGPAQQSQLTHWPVQLRLLPAGAPVLKGAKLLIAADCVPVAYADFHARMLRDHAVVIACPKLDDTSGYVEKLEEMIRHGDLREIVVARMEVPCCAGILHTVFEAHRRAGSAVPLFEIVVGTRGQAQSRRRVA